MQKTFIGILVVLLIVIIFALQNSIPVNVSFWFWSINTNLSLLLLLSVTFGAIVSFILSLPLRAKKNKIILEKEEKIKLLGR